MAKCGRYSNPELRALRSRPDRPDARRHPPCGIARHDDGRRLRRSASERIPRPDALRSHRHAWHGRDEPPAREPDRARRAQARRNRGRRGDRGQRRDRIDGTDRQRRRRRSVRDRLGREDAEAPRPERERPFAEVADAREAEVGAREARLEDDSAARSTAGVGARDRRWMVRAARQVRQDSDEGICCSRRSTTRATAFR